MPQIKQDKKVTAVTFGWLAFCAGLTFVGYRFWGLWGVFAGFFALLGGFGLIVLWLATNYRCGQCGKELAMVDSTLSSKVPVRHYCKECDIMWEAPINIGLFRGGD